ncbi:hypothetical protein JB92DRAFT_3051035 [Gautieria morchelliformis]|nr:hypothetical protein JB92DRAFT_3051035 [Gautieria morchelliformis]
MPNYRVAIVGGGIAGLCLAASLVSLNSAAGPESEVYVDVYEAAPEFVELGAGLTLWGRVCEALRLMGMDEDCVRAAVVVASSYGAGATDGFVLRGFRDKADYGRLPFRDAWSLHRADLINILARRVPRVHAHLGKRLVAYRDPSSDPSSSSSSTSTAGPITLTFADATTATCNVLVGADGLRSVVRAQMMRDASRSSTPNTASTSRADLKPFINPQWTGTLAYRTLVPVAALRARNPSHPILRGGVVYFGKSQHVVGYPISPTTLNLAINVTNLAHVDTEWPPHPSHSTSTASASSQYQPGSSHSSTSPTATRERAVGSRKLDRATYRREVLPRFGGWGDEVRDVVESVDTCTEWPVMDLNPLPFYTRGRVVLMGDAAHAAVPYVGAGAAFAIEDAYILSHLFHAASRATDNRNPIARALHTYQLLRLPRGNALVQNARIALRSFQFNGPCGENMRGSADVVCRVFEGAAGMGGSASKEYASAGADSGRGPEEDMKWGVSRVMGLL